MAGIGLSVVTFNILSKSWAQPDFYPASSHVYLTAEGNGDRLRKNIIIIRTMAYRKEYPVSIFGIQETEDQPFRSIVDSLNLIDKVWVGFQVFHCDNYWSTHIPPAKFGGSSLRSPGGVGLIFRSDLFTINGITIEPGVYNSSIFLADGSFLNFDFPLGSDGNRAIFVGDLFYLPADIKLKVSVIHLDSETEENRLKEARDIVALFKISSGSEFDHKIILGDFNSDTDRPNMKNIFKDFNNALGEKDWDVNFRSSTHPFSSSDTFNENYEDQIDHIMISKTFISKIDIPQGNKADDTYIGVVDSNLWRIFPRDEGKDYSEEFRISSNFSITGSDHFPIVSRLVLAPIRIMKVIKNYDES